MLFVAETTLVPARCLSVIVGAFLLNREMVASNGINRTTSTTAYGIRGMVPGTRPAQIIAWPQRGGILAALEGGGI